MPKNTQIDNKKKLLALFRLEPGCLGPEGSKHVEDFCKFAQKQCRTFNNTFMLYKITPRYDKTLPETEYLINGKKLEQVHVEKYLQLLKKNIADIEESFEDKLTLLIEQYFER